MYEIKSHYFNQEWLFHISRTQIIRTRSSGWATYGIIVIFFVVAMIYAR